MKVIQLVGFALIAIVSASALAAPKWDAAHVKEVRFREGVPGQEVRVVGTPKEVEELLGYFQRATEVGKTEGKRDWPKCMDLVGERPESGRWLYDPITGEFTRLDPKAQSVYRFAESDRRRVNAHFEKRE